MVTSRPQMPPYAADGGIARAPILPARNAALTAAGGMALGDYPPGPQPPPYRGDGGMARGDYPPVPQYAAFTTTPIHM